MTRPNLFARSSDRGQAPLGSDVSHRCAIVIGIGVGLAAGHIAGRLPVAPALQSLSAAFVAMKLAEVSVWWLWWWLLLPRQTAYAVDISVYVGIESLLLLAGVGVIAAGLHFLRAAPVGGRQRSHSIAPSFSAVSVGCVARCRRPG